MKAQDFAVTLNAFAKLVEAQRADELRKLAGAFGVGKEETVAARVKKMNRAAAHPATLKASLELIQSGFKAAGATKQVAAIGVVLAAFAGQGDATVDMFIAKITAPPPPPPKKARSLVPPEPNASLARELADELARTVLDTVSFKEVVKRLRDTKIINTPTLAIVANRFLGNAKQYTGRKEPIDEIVRRQKADAREHARAQALGRLGV